MDADFAVEFAKGAIEGAAELLQQDYKHLGYQVVAGISRQEGQLSMGIMQAADFIVGAAMALEEAAASVAGPESLLFAPDTTTAGHTSAAAAARTAAGVTVSTAEWAAQLAAVEFPDSAGSLAKQEPKVQCQGPDSQTSDSGSSKDATADRASCKNAIAASKSQQPAEETNFTSSSHLPTVVPAQVAYQNRLSLLRTLPPEAVIELSREATSALAKETTSPDSTIHEQRLDILKEMSDQYKRTGSAAEKQQQPPSTKSQSLPSDSPRSSSPVSRPGAATPSSYVAGAKRPPEGSKIFERPGIVAEKVLKLELARAASTGTVDAARVKALVSLTCLPGARSPSHARKKALASADPAHVKVAVSSAQNKQDSPALSGPPPKAGKGGDLANPVQGAAIGEMAATSSEFLNTGIPELASRPQEPTLEPQESISGSSPVSNRVEADAVIQGPCSGEAGNDTALPASVLSMLAPAEELRAKLLKLPEETAQEDKASHKGVVPDKGDAIAEEQGKVTNGSKVMSVSSPVPSAELVQPTFPPTPHKAAATAESQAELAAVSSPITKASVSAEVPPSKTRAVKLLKFSQTSSMRLETGIKLMCLLDAGQEAGPSPFAVPFRRPLPALVHPGTHQTEKVASPSNESLPESAETSPWPVSQPQLASSIPKPEGTSDHSEAIGQQSSVNGEAGTPVPPTPSRQLQREGNVLETSVAIAKVLFEEAQESSFAEQQSSQGTEPTTGTANVHSNEETGSAAEAAISKLMPVPPPPRPLDDSHKETMAVQISRLRAAMAAVKASDAGLRAIQGKSYAKEPGRALHWQDPPLPTASEHCQGFHHMAKAKELQEPASTRSPLIGNLLASAAQQGAKPKGAPEQISRAEHSGHSSLVQLSPGGTGRSAAPSCYSPTPTPPNTPILPLSPLNSPTYTQQLQSSLHSVSAALQSPRPRQHQKVSHGPDTAGHSQGRQNFCRNAATKVTASCPEPSPRSRPLQISPVLEQSLYSDPIDLTGAGSVTASLTSLPPLTSAQNRDSSYADQRQRAAVSTLIGTKSTQAEESGSDTSTVYHHKPLLPFPDLKPGSEFAKLGDTDQLPTDAATGFSLKQVLAGPAGLDMKSALPEHDCLTSNPEEYKELPDGLAAWSRRLGIRRMTQGEKAFSTFFNQTYLEVHRADEPLENPKLEGPALFAEENEVFHDASEGGGDKPSQGGSDQICAATAKGRAPLQGSNLDLQVAGIVVLISVALLILVAIHLAGQVDQRAQQLPT